MRTNEAVRYTKWMKLLVLGIAIVGQLFFLQNNVIPSHAQTIGTITASTANIRQSPDSSSTAIAGVEYGDEVDVTAQTTGADTYTWYKVLDGGNVGYIRADLISVEDSVPVETDTSSTDTSSTDTSDSDSSDTSSGVSASQVATAKVIVASVNVRASADTSAAKQGSAAQDTVVNVTGEVIDSDGATWYQVSFDSDGTTVNGYIRSDFLEVVDMVAEEEETTTEEDTTTEENTVVETSDAYSLEYIENSEGVMDWYLYDNDNGIKQSLTDMIDYIDYTQSTRESEQAQLRMFKIGLIVAVVIIVILIIVITVIALKYRQFDIIYEEEEEVEAEEQPKSKIVPKEEMKTRRASTNYASEKSERSFRRGEERNVSRDNIPTESMKKMKTEEKTWESQNFLAVDDDMEFEFLDIKK